VKDETVRKALTPRKAKDAASRKKPLSAAAGVDARKLHRVSVTPKAKSSTGKKSPGPATADLNLIQERYFRLFELAPVGYFVLDDTGEILQVNAMGVEQIGIAG
jgi:PAS domain-containing protein